MSAKPFVPATQQPAAPSTGAGTGAGQRKSNEGNRHHRGRGGFGPRNNAGGPQGRGTGFSPQPGQFVYGGQLFVPPPQPGAVVFLTPFGPQTMNPMGRGVWYPPS